MDIDIYGDQNNIKYPNKIKLIKLAVELMKSDKFLYILREKKRAWIHVLVLESVHDFYNFRVNHAQFYVNGNTVKPWPRLHMTLAVDGMLNTNTTTTNYESYETCANCTDFIFCASHAVVAL